MKKIVAIWLLSSLISFGMLRYFMLEKFCYHGVTCKEVTNTTAYIIESIGAIFGPLSLVAVSVTIVAFDKLGHSPFGLALSKNIMWPKHHNHSVTEPGTPKVKSAYTGIED